MSEDERKAQIDKWNEEIKTHWKVEKGEIVNDGKGAYLTTDKDYGDIELLIDYKMYPKGDSGIYLRATPQVQIWDYTKEGGKWNLGADKGSGGLWNNSPGSPGKDPLVLADKPFGEWNSFPHPPTRRTDHGVSQRQARRQQRPPGELLEPQDAAVEERSDPAANARQRDPLAQHLRPRDPLRTRPTNCCANSATRKGFEDVFNGKDFDGWAGPIDNYRGQGRGHPVQAAARAAPSTPRRNTAISSPGWSSSCPRAATTAWPSATPATATPPTSACASCKCWTTPTRASIRGRPTARPTAWWPLTRGYQRPIGEWNYQEVTVKGPTIKVELNGTVILDCDLSKVTEYMANSTHPGKDRTSGHFGFAGHNDPVAFRNIQIKRLEKK